MPVIFMQKTRDKSQNFCLNDNNNLLIWLFEHFAHNYFYSLRSSVYLPLLPTIK